MSTPTVLPAAALPRTDPVPPGRTRFVAPALRRAALYLIPVPLAIAAHEQLAVVPWQVPAGALVAGWCARSALAHLGQIAADRAGAGSAARLVLVGFVTVVAAWSGLLALAPPALAGTDLPLAYAVSLPALVLLAAITAAQATGGEAVLLRWSAPGLLVAGAAIAGGLPGPGPVAAQPAAVLPAAIAVLAVRAFAPATRPPDRAAGPPVTRAEVRAGVAALALGAGQAAAVVLVWRVGGMPALLPLLVSLPLIECGVGWHRTRLARGLTRYSDRDRFLRYRRRLGWWTLAAPLPPLVTGAALAGTASRLPYGLSTHPDAPRLLLALAAGVLLAGVVAIGRLLAARDRPGLAAIVTGAPVPVAFALAASVPGVVARSLSGWGELLPAAAIALALGYAAGLVLAAYVLFDSRSPQ